MQGFRSKHPDRTSRRRHWPPPCQPARSVESQEGSSRGRVPPTAPARGRPTDWRRARPLPVSLLWTLVKPLAAALKIPSEALGGATPGRLGESRRVPPIVKVYSVSTASRAPVNRPAARPIQGPQLSASTTTTTTTTCGHLRHWTTACATHAQTTELSWSTHLVAQWSTQYVSAQDQTSSSAGLPATELAKEQSLVAASRAQLERNKTECWIAALSRRSL